MNPGDGYRPWGRSCFGVVMLAAILLSRPSPGSATEVSVVGVTPGQKASVAIDGAAPITMVVGETVGEVKLLQVHRDGAVLRIDGVSTTLPLESGRAAGSSRGASSGSSINLAANPQGHFVTNAAVNGRTMSFIVDTGATLTTLSRAHAERLGLRYRDGARQRAQTANGTVNGWMVNLKSVTVRNVTVHNVAAMVVDTNSLPSGLLGMSFLRHFELRQQGSTLVLRRR